MATRSNLAFEGRCERSNHNPRAQTFATPCLEKSARSKKLSDSFPLLSTCSHIYLQCTAVQVGSMRKLFLVYLRCSLMHSILRLCWTHGASSIEEGPGTSNSSYCVETDRSWLVSPFLTSHE